MGWRFPWVSSQGGDFNRDFSAFNEKDRENGTGYNFGTPKRAELHVIKDEELMALSAFALEDGVVYHTTLATTAVPMACTWSGSCSTERQRGATKMHGRAGRSSMTNTEWLQKHERFR
jgi:predicted dithiol-disulfide oxidoreductase (DUF899 family)